VYSGAANLASTVARAGVDPATIHVSQTEFISLNVEMSASQIFTDKSFVFSEPACASKASICARMSFVFCGVSYLTGKIDSVSVNNGLAHTRACSDTCDGHELLLIAE